MARIFINYRRDDTAGYAGWLFTLLKDHFSTDDIFMDIDSLDVGVDFVSTIEHEIGSCDAVVALIGPTWLSASDAAGNRRLDDPQDFVRLELATALRRGVRVCPALVHGAKMPNADALPEDLKPLVRRNAIELNAARFADDVRRLVTALERALAESPPPRLAPLPDAGIATPERAEPLHVREYARPPAGGGAVAGASPAGVGTSQALRPGLRQRWARWSGLKKAAAILGAVIAGYLLIAVIYSATRGSGASGPRSAASATAPAGSQHGAPPATHSRPGAAGLSHPVYLDTLPATIGADTSNDQITPGQVSIGGHTYQHGEQFTVGLVDDTAEASYAIPRGARTFSAVIGNDDNQPNELWAGISALYEVFVDGRRVATGHAQGRTHDPPIDARVTNGSTITLKVTNANGGGGGTRADWADPVFR